MNGRFLLPLLAASVAAPGFAQSIRVRIDGQDVRFRDQMPIERGGRVLVPLRGVFEDMGATVDWDPATRMVHAERSGQHVDLRIGSREADVDGRRTMLDVPARVMNGSTMVPLRFISEALGSTVDWRAYDRTVMINSGYGMVGNDLSRRRGDTYTARQRDETRRVTAQDEIVLERASVIPVVLEERISSSDARKGDRVEARVRAGDEQALSIPRGTRVLGYVASVHRYGNNKPGMLELKFDRMVMPGGREVAIDGTLMDLNSKDIEHRNGRLVAKGSGVDNRGVYAGYGAGAGLVLGLLTKRPLEDAILGGLLGLGAGELERRSKPSDVNLKPGTTFGVRLDQPVTIMRRDIGGR